MEKASTTANPSEAFYDAFTTMEKAWEENRNGRAKEKQSMAVRPGSTRMGATIQGGR